MSSLYAWLTPDDAPDPNRCWRVLVPGGEAYEAAFRGALALLAMSENWEKHGTLTPDEAAQVFLDANFLSFEMRPCMPVGTVFFSARTTAPDGSLICDGASYATADYSSLFDAIGYTWGGSGANFNVPDMRKRVARGSGSGAAVGDAGGAETVTLSTGEMPSHNHSINEVLGVGGTPNPVPAWIPSAIPLVSTNSAGGDGAHENMPPYRTLLPCISFV